MGQVIDKGYSSVTRRGERFKLAVSALEVRYPITDFRGEIIQNYQKVID